MCKPKISGAWGKPEAATTRETVDNYGNPNYFPVSDSTNKASEPLNYTG